MMMEESNVTNLLKTAQSFGKLSLRGDKIFQIQG